MTEVDPGHFNSLLADVLPDVQFRPVAQGKDAHVFADVEPGIVEVPDLGPLIIRVPLAECIAEAEESLLRPRLLLIAPSSTDAAIESKFFDGSQQSGDLEMVAAHLTRSENGNSISNSFIDRSDD